MNWKIGCMAKDKLLVVYDPTVEAQPALARAAIAAEDGIAQIHLFACIHSYLAKPGEESGEAERLIAAQEDKLARAAAPLIEKGAEVTTEVEWSKDWCQAILDAAVRCGVDGVIKSSRKHTAGQRRLSKTSDWVFIRNCPLPLLLVKQPEVSRASRVLAAVQNCRYEDSCKELNNAVLGFCQRFLGRSDIDIQFVSAYDNLADRPDRGALIRACGVESDKIHIKMGKPSKVIVKRARKMNADLVVIGNSARTGLAALVNPNTVENVLDKLDCDLLCVP